MEDIHGAAGKRHARSDGEFDATYLLKTSKEAKSKKPIAIIEVRPHGNTRVPLGTFSDQYLPKGFVLEISPDPDPPNSLVSKVVSLLKGRSEQYELMLFLENFGLWTTTVEIWEVK